MEISPFLLAAIIYSGILGTITMAATSNNIYAQAVNPPGLSRSFNETSNNATESIDADINATEPVPNGNFSSAFPPQTEPSIGNDSGQSREIIKPNPIRSTDPCIEYDEESHQVEIICDTDIYQLFIGLRDDSITEQLGSGTDHD